MPATGRLRASLAWAGLVAAVTVPVAVSATSPLLEWRDPVYIAAGLAGVIAMALLLVQPLLIGGYLPGLSTPRGRQVHRLVGIGLVALDHGVSRPEQVDVALTTYSPGSGDPLRRR